LRINGVTAIEFPSSEIGFSFYCPLRGWIPPIASTPRRQNSQVHGHGRRTFPSSPLPRSRHPAPRENEITFRHPLLTLPKSLSRTDRLGNYPAVIAGIRWRTTPDEDFLFGHISFFLWKLDDVLLPPPSLAYPQLTQLHLGDADSPGMNRVNSSKFSSPLPPPFETGLT